MQWEDNLKELKKHFTYQELSQLCGMAQSTVYNIHKKKCIPNRRFVYNIEKAYKQFKTKTIVNPRIDFNDKIEFLLSRYSQTQLAKILKCNINSITLWIHTHGRRIHKKYINKINYLYEQEKNKD
jgi:transcriptional regulator with XRE-family HTH domain